MGIFSKLFGRKKIEKITEEKVPEVCEMPEAKEGLEVHETPEAGECPEAREIPEAQERLEPREEMIAKVMKRLKEITLKPVIHMEFNIEPVELTDSKMGGVPYLPEGDEVPTDENGHQLRLLAQIRLADLPENKAGLPEEGLLQFWALDNDVVGLETDLDKMIESKGHRVIWYPSVDESVTEEAVLEKYHPYFDEKSYFPVQDIFGIRFAAGEESLSCSDCRFDRIFAEIWNEIYPSDKISGYSELDVEIPDEMMDEIGGAGHKIGGYPMFTQWEPREGDMGNYKVLLLQIDSFGVEGKDIMRGDSGVGNFFITPEDLEKREFSRVLYSRDCY